jgi:hypothetical protein
MSDTKPTVIPLTNPIKELMTPAVRWTIFGDSYHHEPHMERLISYDKRYWFVPSAFLEGKKSFSEIVEEREKLPVIEGNIDLKVFAFFNNAQEGTIKIPDVGPEDTIGYRLPVTQAPNKPGDQLDIEDVMIIDLPQVVILKQTGEELRDFSYEGQRVSLMEAFWDFQRLKGPGPEPDPYRLLKREGDMGPEGDAPFSFYGKER